MDLEPGAGPAGIAQVIGRPQLGEQIEAALALEQAQELDQPRRRHIQAQVVAKSRRLRDTVAQALASVARVAAWGSAEVVVVLIGSLVSVRHVVVACPNLSSTTDYDSAAPSRAGPPGRR